MGFDFGDIVVTSWGVNPQTWRCRKKGVKGFLEIAAKRDADPLDLYVAAAAAFGSGQEPKLD